ncbi:MAG: enoyl-CoA hydratase family protein [Planctomycetota bacterium]
MADPEIVNPTTLARPNGYSHGVLFPAGGRVLFVAGQVAWDAEGQLVGQDDFVAQFRCALANALAVVRAAGGGPESVGRFTIYVTDRRGYREHAGDWPGVPRADGEALPGDGPGAGGCPARARRLARDRGHRHRLSQRRQPRSIADVAGGTRCQGPFRRAFAMPSRISPPSLDRPDKLNALTFEAYEELSATFEALQTHAEPRAVLLTGAGRGFCSGGDVNAIIAELFARDMQGLDFTRLTCRLIRSMRQLRCPIVAALNGVTAGAGAVMALASDFRIASTEARIAFLFVKVGLSGADMGAAFLLPRVIGLGRATELLMLGDFIDAQTAERYGLYQRVVPGEHLLASAQALAARLAAGPAFALGMTKEMLNRELVMDLDTALEAEAQAQALCMLHPDYQIAHQAFLAKQPPAFKGRS